ncbi:MAG: hypothetical protein QM796_13240 [Chthoniobacteraceae bacterium]
MHIISIPIAELKPALTGLGKVVNKRPARPADGCIKIERTKDGWITLTAADVNSFVTVRLEEPSRGTAMSLLVSYENLTRLAKACGKDEALIIHPAKDDKALIQFPIGNQLGEEHVESLPVGDFLAIPRIKTEAFSLSNEVRTSLQSALECISTDINRPQLQGAYIDVSQEKCHQIVGTDGTMLYASNSFHLPLAQSLILPGHKFLAWKEFNNDGEWQLKVQPPESKKESGWIQISTRRWRFMVRQIEGHYPNWRQVIPSSSATTIAIPDEVVPAILNIIPRIPCPPDDRYKTIGIQVEQGKVSLLGRVALDESWQAVELHDVATKGVAVTVYLNREHLQHALELRLKKIELNDECSAIRFSDGGRQFIVMPVRVGGTPPASSTPSTEPTTASSAEPASNEATTATTAVAKTERIIHMPRIINRLAPSNGIASEESSEAKPAIEAALDQIENIKGSYKGAIRGLNDLTDTLKQVQRDRKTADREVQGVRATLEKLKTVSL